MTERLDPASNGTIGQVAIRGPVAAIAIGFLGLIPVGIGLLLFTSSGRDDAHITYWAAHTLANHAEIVNYNGERLEQSSSLLDVLLLAFLSKFMPFSLPAISRILSIVCAIALTPLSYMLAEDAAPGRGLAAAWLTASASSLAYWSVSGMETTLSAATAVAMALMVLRLIRAPWRTGLLLGAMFAIAGYLLARPESSLILICGLSLLLGILIVRIVSGGDQTGAIRRFANRCFAVLVVVMVMTGLLMSIRRGYFGEWFPHPVLAKSEGPVFVKGFKYFVQVALDGCESAFWCLGAAGSIALVFTAIRREPIQIGRTVVASILIANLAFIVASGGDWMEGGRFLVAAAPFSAIVTVVVMDRVIRRAHFRPVLAGLVALQILASVQIGRFTSTGSPLWASIGLDHRQDAFAEYSWVEVSNRVNRRDMPLVLHLIEWVRRIHPQTQAPVTIMGHNMGMIAYCVALSEFGKVHFLDMHGLTTSDFLECPVTANRPRSASGLALSFERYFDLLPEIQNQCGQAAPDIIFDCVDSERQLEYFRNRGYAIVYFQHGSVSSGSEHLPGAKVAAEQMIAIRKDLLSAPVGTVEYEFTRR